MNRVIVKKAAGRNLARFQSTDFTEIRRLLGQAALLHASIREN
jgi:hypothetical protein